jgi:hypothetical protein
MYFDQIHDIDFKNNLFRLQLYPRKDMYSIDFLHTTRFALGLTGRSGSRSPTVADARGVTSNHCRPFL